MSASRQDILLGCALKYAERQPIVPVDVDKTPLIPLKDASQDPDVIRRWVSDLAPSGIALRTDNLVVIDVAPDAEDHGLDEWLLPATREQQSPSGGRHYFFRRATGASIESASLGHGRELITGPERYVVVAPSRNGQGSYEWVVPRGQTAPAPIVELSPEHLTVLVAARPTPETPQPEPTVEASDRATRPGPGNVTMVDAPAAGDDLVSDVKLSDVGNGIRIAVRHGHDLRYCHSWARWLTWDGRRWSDEDPGEPVRRAKENARWLAVSALDLHNDKERAAVVKWALESEKDARIRAALAMAQSEPGISIAPADLDQHHWLLNVQNGTLDLVTGQLRAHDRGDLLTKLAPVVFDPKATAPLWESVLERALPDGAVREYVQQLAGYALTGSTREQRISIWWGSGSNAKSTVINTILSLLGEDYGQEAAPSVFLERRGDSIPNDIARLRGARLVIAVETAQNRKLNEALVKAMTGGDRLVARFMRSEFFEFVPTFTPVLVTNHLPVTTDATHALWRRIDIVPFTETIGDDERDLDLPDKLRAEMPGILNWALAGCLAWQKHGLQRPEAVVEATAGYRTDMDALGRFVADCCELGTAAKTSAEVLYNRYAYWADANGEEKLSKPHFGRRLASDLGLKSKRGTGGKHFWLGIQTVSDEPSDAK